MYAARGIDLRGPLRGGASTESLRELITGVWHARTDRGAEHRLTGGEHWLVEAQGRDRLDASGGQVPVQTTEVRSAGQRRLVALSYWVDGQFTADPFVAKLLQTKAVLLGGPAPAAVIVASTPYDTDPSVARATKALRISGLRPV